MPSYILNPTGRDAIKRRYTRAELLEKTTIQLRNICFEEKLVPILVHTLDREGLISTILKFRGADESLLIREYNEAGFERVSQAVKKYLVTKIPEHDKIKIPAKIILYHEFGIDKQDMYKVQTENDIEESNVLLVNDNDELCGIFNLMRDEGNLYYLVAKKNLRVDKSKNRKYSFLFFRKVDSEYLYKLYTSDEPMPPKNFQYYKIPIPDMEIRDVEETSTVLAIDFGTSNTTAGAFLGNNYVTLPCYNDILNERIKLNEINFVRFLDVTQKEEAWQRIFPTVLYTKDCSDPDNVKYYFGYEAKRLMQKNDYSSKASVFQGIKRWVNSYFKTEEIYDDEGNVATVKRSDIISAYIMYVIKTAEHQFKCRFRNIHISSPVKLKQQFIDMFQEIIPEYNIESEDALDEGVAVLYNTIADHIEKNSFDPKEEYKALIVDCGGGTTDLSSCSFRIKEGYISYKVDVKTTYENGDTNFGGNNITYRIMQFMKIIFAHYYTHDKEIVDIDRLIDIPSADIFRYVDEIGVDKIYKDFERFYEEAEMVIPTRFKEYENKNEGYQVVKNNFFFLWEIADDMKKEFFRRTNILRNRFDALVIEEQESDLNITALNKWNLSVLDDGKFKTMYEFPNVVFNIKELNKLIMGDIYELVRKFFEGFYNSGKLQEYKIIKLTGQSCRIDIFKEALKEFVPGRSLYFKQNKDDDDIISDLKLSCLRGVLRYINSKTIGDIEANIENDVPVVPYSVTAFTFDKREKILICSLEKMNQIKGFISRPIGVLEVEFYLKSVEGNLRQAYLYRNNFNDYELILPEEVTEKFNKIYQEDTDTIRNGEVRFFLLAHDKSWGFHVIPVARKDDQLFMGKKKFYPFEDDLSELDFFDGLK